MKVMVLIDNIGNERLPRRTGTPPLYSEWGLSFYIEYGERKVLLDAGGSGHFADNADELGISLAEVDAAVLSHAHYDHADGMETFFERNRTAKLYLREACGENCCRISDSKTSGERMKYIGIRKGFFDRYGERIIRVSGDYTISEGIRLLPHTTPGLAQAGAREKMYIREGNRWVTDCFAHEQSLVFETAEGPVVFNSCCHAGADNVIREVQAAYPGQTVRALIGGFHLYNKSENYIRNFAGGLRQTGSTILYTGHCTGQEGYEILKDELGERVKRLRSGMRFEL